MKNKGKATRRFKDNPCERSIAEAWEKINTDRNGNLDGCGTLDYLLAEKVNEPNCEVTERDRMVAATVIQWLGSPMGMLFLKG